MKSHQQSHTKTLGSVILCCKSLKRVAKSGTTIICSFEKIWLVLRAYMLCTMRVLYPWLLKISSPRLFNSKQIFSHWTGGLLQQGLCQKTFLECNISMNCECFLVKDKTVSKAARISHVRFVKKSTVSSRPEIIFYDKLSIMATKFVLIEEELLVNYSSEYNFTQLFVVVMISLNDGYSKLTFLMSYTRFDLPMPLQV